jgi:hypothetical protein
VDTSRWIGDLGQTVAAGTTAGLATWDTVDALSDDELDRMLRSRTQQNASSAREQNFVPHRGVLGGHRQDSDVRPMI